MKREKKIKKIDWWCLRKFIPPKFLLTKVSTFCSSKITKYDLISLSTKFSTSLFIFFQSPFFRHFKQRPSQISVEQWEILRRKAKTAVEDYVKPSFKKLYGFLRYRYLQITSIFEQIFENHSNWLATLGSQ